MSNTLKLGNGQWATGKDTLLGYNSENNNIKPLPFSFSRDSSATVVNKDGLIETVGSGEPRIDFKDNTKGALLLEPQRSNLIDNSSNFFVNSWAGTRVVKGSTINAPDGNNEAHKLIATAVNNTHYREYTLSSASSGSYTGSCFFKKGEYNVGVIRMGADSNVNRYSIYFSLEDASFIQTATVGSPTGTSYKIEDFENGWYRLSVTITHTSGDLRMSLSNAPSNYSNSNGLPVFLGNNSDGGYAWGAQLESNASYATSYIPTSGSAVTRVADSSSQTLPSPVFNSYPFSVFVEVDVVDTSSGYAFSLLNKASSNNYFTIEYYSSKWHIVARPSGSTITRSSLEILTKGTHKLVGVYTDTNLKLYLNGSLIASGSNTQSFNSNIDSLLLGQLRISGDTNSRNTVRQTELYNNELTDAEAIALTS
jgi:hypothetical protein